MIFDTHLHLIDRTRLHYPWLAGAPALDRDWSWQSYVKDATRLGITDVLHMEVDVAPTQIEAETSFIAALMAQPGSILRGAISGARPEAPGFEAWLERVDRRVIKGLRRILHTQDDALSQSERFRDNMRLLGTAGLPFDLCVLARQLDVAADLVDAAPDTVFVLDHCGVPDIAGEAFAPWARGITALAERPNVRLKLSGITAYAGADWSLTSLRPWVDHVLESFGPARMVWGSDHPVCTLQSDLGQWVGATHALLADLGASERAAILHGNARQIWAV